MGLSTEIDKSKFGEKVSGVDILQIWILLFNAGHLHGTFATERAILRCCKKYEDLRKMISESLFEQGIRDEFKALRENDDIYKFHRILIAFNLEIYKKNSEDERFIDFLLKIIMFYFKDEDDEKLKKKQIKYKYIFTRIRQLSYLFLDSQYTPFPISFNLSLVFLNFPDYYDHLFTERNDPIIRTLESFQDLLSIIAYHSAESIRELGRHARRIEDKIDKERGEKITNAQELYEYLYLKNDNEFSPEPYDWQDALNLYVLFEIDSPESPLIKIFKKKSTELETSWSEKYKESCQLTFQPGSNQKHMVITLALLPNSEIRRNMKIIGEFLEDLITLYFEIKEERGINKNDLSRVDEIFQKVFDEQTIFILKYITNGKFSFELKKENLLHKTMMPIRETEQGLMVIEEELLDIKDEDRKKELKVFRQVLKDLDCSSKMLISLSRIDVYDYHGEPFTDFDGFGFGFKDGYLGILIVETKETRKKCQNLVRDQFINKKELGFKTSEDLETKIKQVKPGANCYAYCYLTIDGNSN